MSNSEHKQVMVTWPGGNRTGPYKQTFKYSNNDVELWIDGKKIIIPAKWTEEITPDIEEGRLVFVEIEGRRTYGEYKGSNDQFYEIKNRGAIWPTDKPPKPVNRRWNELTEDEKSWIKSAIEMNPTNMDIFRVIYNIITGEEHP